MKDDWKLCMEGLTLAEALCRFRTLLLEDDPDARDSEAVSHITLAEAAVRRLALERGMEADLFEVSVHSAS